MYERFTDRARKVMQLANQEAQRFNHEYIGTEHILLGLVIEGSGVAANVLKNLDIDLRKIRLEVEKIVPPGPDTITKGKLPQTPRAKKVIEYSIEEARNLNHNYVGTEHLLLGLLRESEGIVPQIFLNLGITIEQVREELLHLVGHKVSDEGTVEQAAAPLMSKTPTLDALGRDVTELARKGQLDPLLGRTAEMERVIQILARRSGNSLILVGDAGVGKTAIVEWLAQLVVSDIVPEGLRDVRIVALNLDAVFQGAKDAEQARSRLQKLTKEVLRHRKVLLCFDPLYLVQSRNQGTGAAFDLFKLPLMQGEIQCIATATPEQWRQKVVEDPVLQRLFQPIQVAPPSKQEAVYLLRGVRDRYEVHHRVRIRDEAVDAAVELSDRYLVETALPYKAIQLMDDACTLVRLKALARPPDQKELDEEVEQLNRAKEEAVAEQDFEKAAHLRDVADKLKKKKDSITREWLEKVKAIDGNVDEAAVAEIVAKMTGIPASHLRLGSAAYLVQLGSEIGKKVVAQEQAIIAVEQAVRRGYANLRDHSRPLASFIFAGPPGVGKTLLAGALAEFLFGHPAALLRLDMAAYRDREDVPRFVGGQETGTGAWDGGGLIDKVRGRPHSVVLFDGIEEAHADVHTFLLRILREGVLTDRFGRTVDFRNTILILNTPHDLAESVYGSGAVGSLERARAMFKTESRTRLRRELVDQVDEVVAFRRLKDADFEAILDVDLARLAAQLRARKVDLEVGADARRFLVDNAGDPDRGARGLQRAVEQVLVNSLSEVLLRLPGPGAIIVRVDPRGDALACEVKAADDPRNNFV